MRRAAPLPFRRIPAAVLLSLALLALPLEAAKYRVVDENGRAVPGARVSILGRAGSVAADPKGELTLESEPPPPFELGVFSPSGAWLGIVRVESRTQGDAVRDLVLPAARSTEVFVSAGTAASLLAPPANPVSLVSKRELEERQPSRLVEAIESLPGVGKSDESSSAVPVVRGLARGRTLVMLDDGRVSAERRAGASASYLNPFALEAVEVVRGPGSVAYGSDALGGIVHARTPMPEPGVFGARYRFSAGAGGSPEATGGVGLNVPAGPAAFSLSLYQRSQGDYESPNGVQDNSAVRDRGFVLRGLVPLGEARLWASYQLDQVRDMGKPQADLPTTRTFYPSENSSRFTLGLDVPDVAGFSSLELRGFLGEYGIVTNRQRQPNETTTLRNALSDVDAKDYSVRLLGRRSFGAAGLRVGADVNGRTGLEALNIVESFDEAGNQTFGFYRPDYSPRLAATYLHVRESHFATSDVPATLLATLALVACARIAAGGTRRDYALAGLWIGAATATKYSSLAVVVSLVAAHLLAAAREDRCRRDAGGNAGDVSEDAGTTRTPSASERPSAAGSSRASRSSASSAGGQVGPLVGTLARALADRRLLVAGLVAGLTFLVAVPYAVLDWPAFHADVALLAERGRTGFKGLALSPDPGWVFYPKTLAWGMEAPLFAAALLGVIAALFFVWQSGRLSWEVLRFMQSAAPLGAVGDIVHDTLVGNVHGAAYAVITAQLCFGEKAVLEHSILVHPTSIQQDDAGVGCLVP